MWLVRCFPHELSPRPTGGPRQRRYTRHEVTAARVGRPSGRTWAFTGGWLYIGCWIRCRVGGLGVGGRILLRGWAGCWLGRGCGRWRGVGQLRGRPPCCRRRAWLRYGTCGLREDSRRGRSRPRSRARECGRLRGGRLPSCAVIRRGLRGRRTGEGRWGVRGILRRRRGRGGWRWAEVLRGEEALAEVATEQRRTEEKTEEYYFFRAADSGEIGFRVPLEQEVEVELSLAARPGGSCASGRR